MELSFNIDGATEKAYKFHTPGANLIKLFWHILHLLFFESYIFLHVPSISLFIEMSMAVCSVLLIHPELINFRLRLKMSLHIHFK